METRKAVNENKLTIENFLLSVDVSLSESHSEVQPEGGITGEHNNLILTNCVIFYNSPEVTVTSGHWKGFKKRREI